MILLGPRNIGHADLGDFMQRPRGIGEMGPRDRAKIGATRRDDRIDVIGLGNGADRDRVDMRLVADLIGVWNMRP
jgi:hypothetical protein